MNDVPEYTAQQLSAGYREWIRRKDAAYAANDGALSTGYALRAHRCLEALRDKLGLKSTDEAAAYARKEQPCS